MQTQPTPAAQRPKSVTVSVNISVGNRKSEVAKIWESVRERYTRAEIHACLRVVMLRELKRLHYQANAFERAMQRFRRMKEAEVEQEFIRLVAKHKKLDLPPLQDVEEYATTIAEAEHAEKLRELRRLRDKRRKEADARGRRKRTTGHRRVVPTRTKRKNPARLI